MQATPPGWSLLEAAAALSRVRLPKFLCACVWGRQAGARAQHWQNTSKQAVLSLLTEPKPKPRLLTAQQVKLLCLQCVYQELLTHVTEERVPRSKIVAAAVGTYPDGSQVPDCGMRGFFCGPLLRAVLLEVASVFSRVRARAHCSLSLAFILSLAREYH